MEIDDIEGTRTNKRQAKFPTRNIMETSDINNDISKNKSLAKLRTLGKYERNVSTDKRFSQLPNNLDYSDLNRKSFVSRRQTNPLNPEY